MGSSVTTSQLNGAPDTSRFWPLVNKLATVYVNTCSSYWWRTVVKRRNHEMSRILKIIQSILYINNKDSFFKYWGDNSDLDVLKSIIKPPGFMITPKKVMHLIIIKKQLLMAYGFSSSIFFLAAITSKPLGNSLYTLRATHVPFDVVFVKDQRLFYKVN